MQQACRNETAAGEEPRRAARRRASARRRWQGRDKLTLVLPRRARVARRLGGAAAGGIDRQAGQGHRADRSASRWARPRSTAPTASSWRIGEHAKLDALEAAGHPVVRLPYRRHASSSARSSSAGSSRRRSPATCCGINPFDQPNVQEAKDATARDPRRREPRRRCATPSIADVLATGHAPATTSRSWPTCRATPRLSARRCRRCGWRCATATASRRRWASGRATCTPPASCTRAARTAASSSSSSTSADAGPADPGPALQLRHAEPRAGATATCDAAAAL